MSQTLRKLPAGCGPSWTRGSLDRPHSGQCSDGVASIGQAIETGTNQGNGPELQIEESFRGAKQGLRKLCFD